MKLVIFLSLLCALLNCSLTFDRCISANKDNVIQEPRHLEVHSGENAVINCTVKGYNTRGANMRKRFKKILFIGPEGNSTDTDYQDRLSWSGSFTHFSVTLKNLTENDSEIYLCDVLTTGNTAICSHGTLLIVRPKVDAANEEQTCGKKSFSPIPYIIISVLLVLCMVVFSIYMKHKRSKEKHNFNQSTYVDMTQTLRRNTMGNSNIYNQTENGFVPT